MFRKYFQLTRVTAKNILSSSNSTILNVNGGNLQKRWAGHSKWQNIKHIKQAADMNKSASFQKLLRLVTLAVKQGGPDPATNSKLKNLMEEAKKINMPKAKIEKALKGCETQLADRPYWTVFSGPRGIVLGIEVSFANNKPGFLNTKLAGQTRKLKFKMEPHFSHLCTERGIIITDPLEGNNKQYEKALEDAIEIGIDEVHETDKNCLIFECAPDRLDSYSQQLMKRGYNIQSSTTELDFKEFVSLQEEEVKNLDTVISNLQKQYEEVIRGSYNIQVQ